MASRRVPPPNSKILVSGVLRDASGEYEVPMVIKYLVCMFYMQTRNDCPAIEYRERQRAVEAWRKRRCSETGRDVWCQITTIIYATIIWTVHLLSIKLCKRLSLLFAISSVSSSQSNDSRHRLQWQAVRMWWLHEHSCMQILMMQRTMTLARIRICAKRLRQFNK